MKAKSIKAALGKLSARFHRTKKPIARRLTKKHYTLISILGIVSLIFMLFLFPLLKDLPSPTKLSQPDQFPVSTQIFDRHQTLLYEIFTDTNRTPVTLAQIPDSVKHATIAIEDQSFYQHFGFSLQGIIRALKNTLFQDKLQGGSTITQQLVKTTLLTPERTLERKFREAILTIATEVLYSKDQILEMYLNHIPYGGTTYGIEAASKRYFGKPAAQLSIAESALLAGLPQAPSRYSPFSNPDLAKARQHEVLRRMVEDGYIDQTAADQAFSQAIEYIPPATNIAAPHFVFYIKELLEQEYGQATVEQGGLRVTTTLDLNLQEMAQATVSAEVSSLERYRVTNGASLITNPQTGEILAMVGSTNYFDAAHDGQVNLTTRLRQPGSSIKPLNYVTALQLKKLHPASVVLDYPTCFKVGSLSPYCPKNYDNSFHGAVSFRSALANSYNIPAVKILAINGLDSMIATASAMGISSFTDPSRYGLSLTLGGGEVTMLDMATAFGTLANQGVRTTLQPILRITTHDGQELFNFDPQQVRQDLEYYFDSTQENSNTIGYQIKSHKRALNREPAFLINDILADNRARSAAFGANSQLVIKNHTVSVKTGTTNDLRDNWTIGYTPNYVVVTWVGNNDNTPMNPYLVSGVTGAAPIWNGIMTQLLIHQEDLVQPKPEEVNGTNVCAQSGAYPTDNNPCDIRYELFWEENTPKNYHPARKNIWVYKDTGYPAFNLISTNETTPEIDPNAIELREHTVISDPFVTDFCLDCPYPANEQGRVQYPSTTIDMNQFNRRSTTAGNQ